jgi:hypothetical protein
MSKQNTTQQAHTHTLPVSFLIISPLLLLIVDTIFILGFSPLWMGGIRNPTLDLKPWFNAESIHPCHPPIDLPPPMAAVWVVVVQEGLHLILDNFKTAA